MAGISSKAAGRLENKFKETGKELQHQEFSDGTGLEEYDFGARYLDPQLGVWHSSYPLANISRRWSPYVDALNNPIRFIDPWLVLLIKTFNINSCFGKKPGEYYSIRPA